MKEIEELNLPADLLYSRDHGWVRAEGDLLVVGISDYAQDQLGDVVYVGLPETGTALTTDQEYGSVESVKAVSELLMPVAGTIIKINAALEESPELVNSGPYGEGWLIKVRPDNPAEYKGLMSRDAYLAMIRG